METSKVVAKYYNEQAKRYLWFSDSSFSWRYIEKPELQRLIKPIVKRTSTILDIGAGNGRISKFLITLGARPSNILGVDISENMLEEARRRIPSEKFVVGDIANVHLPLTRFDLAVSTMVFHYLDLRGLRRALRNVRYSLKPGGRLVMIEPHPVRPYPGHTSADYLQPGWRKVQTPWGTRTLTYHRPVSELLMALIDEGYVVETIHEPGTISAGKRDRKWFKIYSKNPPRIAIVAKKVKR